MQGAQTGSDLFNPATTRRLAYVMPPENLGPGLSRDVALIDHHGVGDCSPVFTQRFLIVNTDHIAKHEIAVGSRIGVRGLNLLRQGARLAFCDANDAFNIYQADAGNEDIPTTRKRIIALV